MRKKTALSHDIDALLETFWSIEPHAMYQPGRFRHFAREVAESLKEVKAAAEALAHIHRQNTIELNSLREDMMALRQKMDYERASTRSL